MDTKQVIKSLKAERKRLDRVITLLSGETAQRAGTRSAGKRKMSAAEKTRRSEAAKARWAKRKKEEKA